LRRSFILTGLTIKPLSKKQVSFLLRICYTNLKGTAYLFFEPESIFIPLSYERWGVHTNRCPSTNCPNRNILIFLEVLRYMSG
jgi:hypothetical protein